jgi:hypothetical protein
MLSTQFLHELTFEPGLPLHDEVQRLAYARHQFVHYFGAAAPRWRVATWAGGASALHGIEWTQLRDTARRDRVRLVSVEPLWAPLLRSICKAEPDMRRAPHGVLTWVEGTHLTCIALECGSLKAVRKLRLRAATLDALRNALVELSADGPAALFVAGFGLDEAGISPMCGAKVLCPLNAKAPELALFDGGPAPKTGLPEVDFRSCRARRPLLAWPLFATSLLVLLTAGLTATRAHEDMLEAQAQQARMEQRIQVHALDAGPTTGASRTGPSKGFSAELDLDRRAEDVQAVLAWKWEPVLTEIEQLGVTANVNWLGLEATAARNEIRLDGLASDRRDALRSVDQLGAIPGWHQVMLGSLQQADAGQAGQRFDIHARLRSDELHLPAPLPASAPRQEGG